MGLNRRHSALYVIAASFVIMTGLCTGKQADAAPDAQQAIAQDYIRMDADAARRDVDSELNYCTPYFIEVKPSGKKMTLDEVRYNAKEYFESADSVSDHTNIVKFVQHGNQAVVTTKQSERVDGMAGSKHVSIRSVETDRDTWTKVFSGWRMSGSIVISEHVTVNGRAVPVE
jgi:hypothetical protein